MRKETYRATVPKKEFRKGTVEHANDFLDSNRAPLHTTVTRKMQPTWRFA